MAMRADASHRISEEVNSAPGGRALPIARADFAVLTERRYSDSQ